MVQGDRIIQCAENTGQQCNEKDKNDSDL